jgi:hypothetical protein
VGLGSNERFDHKDAAALEKAIEAARAFVRLSHDVGGSGVEVKPDGFHPDVPREKTIAQIGKALRGLGEYAEGFGQEIRLEVHGGCAELPVIRAILDAADHRNVRVCWNSNAEDLRGDGLEKNFALVAGDFGRTLHVHELHSDAYPYRRLVELLVDLDYEGWALLEASSAPADRVVALAEPSATALFERIHHGHVLDRRASHHPPGRLRCERLADRHPRSGRARGGARRARTADGR